ncbi:protein kinase [Streptomyces sp. E11-3]|uniref:serine/threonine protein kinase n=1 Tax=Streptomyces sp. E11-3 TaxID=3110112 RepID=UPI00397ECEC8
MTGGFSPLEPGDPEEVGQFQIIARLGAGGMGRVYLGRSPGGRPVAVKVVRPELAEGAEFRKRFAREVAAARRVNGFFTAGVVDADTEGSLAWLATAYVPGMALGDALTEHGPWPLASVLALGAGLAEALGAIHTAGVVHRDLKPSNVLLATDGPRVIDFGISVGGDSSALTRTGFTIGTPGFMSPEQLTGQPVGPASDIFSLGALLACTSTGTSPFGTGSTHELLFRVVYQEPDLESLPLGLREVVEQCLAKDAAQRPGISLLLDRFARAAAAGAPVDTLAEADWLPPAVAHEVWKHASAPLPSGFRPPSPSAPPAAPASSGSAPEPAEPAVTEVRPPPRVHMKPGTGSDLHHAPTVNASTPPPSPDALPPSASLPTAVNDLQAQQSKRKTLLVSLVALTVLAGGAVITTFSLADRGTAPSVPSASTTTSPSSPTASSAPGGSTATASDPPATVTSPAASVPDGFRLATDPANFSLAVPKSFTRSYEPPRIFYYSPGKEFRLGIRNETPDTQGCLAVMHAQHGQGASAYDGYRDGVVTETTHDGYPAALWEFTWDGFGGGARHTFDLCWTQDGRQYDLWVSSPVGKTQEGHGYFETALDTFHPAGSNDG